MRIAILLSIIFAATSCYNNFDSYYVEGRSAVANYTIEQLHANLADRSFTDISTDLVVKGVITANDKSGSLYNSFVIESDGYAMEVLIELNDSFVMLPEGNVTYINLNALRVKRSWGIIQVGLPSSNWGDVEDISGMITIDKHIIVSDTKKPITPEVITLDELTRSDLNSYYGRLVELRNMRLEPNYYLNPNNQWSGTNTFVQCDNTIDEESWLRLSIYTSPYTNYSLTTIPDGFCTITGILSEGSTTPLSLTMRRRSDCAAETIND